MSIRRTLARPAAYLAAPTLAAGLVLAGAAAPATAHVTVTPSDAAAGASSVLTFSFGHGCEGSPTTGITIAIPEEITSVTPTEVAGWQVEKGMAELDEPVTDSHGNTVTERVAEVTYTADEPVRDGYRAAFELSLGLPDAAGETLAFPVVQACQQGQAAWTETAAEGQDPHELERPAPTVTITSADDAGHGAGTAVDEDSGSAGDDAGQTDEAADDSGSNALGVAGLVVGALGLLVGGTALVRTRRG